MENIIVKGQITATSKKQSGDFAQEIPTKTAYVSTDEINSKLLEDFGVQKYTSKEDENYFIIKFPADLMIFKPNGYGEKRPDLSRIELEGVETNNFKTPDDKLLPFNIVKGNHKNNDFFRLQAIRIESDDDIEEIKPENPFGDKPAF